jgi:hypothetical protein
MTTEPKLIPQTIMLRADTYEYYEKESVHAVLEHILKLGDKLDDDEGAWYSRDIRIYIESVKK